MKLKDLIPFGVTIVVAIILLVVGVLVGSPVIKQENMYIQCCNGTPCTDTYYDIKTNLCHLTICELPYLDTPYGFFNKENTPDCVYEGANITNGTLI